MYKKYLPSKKFSLALSIAFVFVVTAVMINYWKVDTKKYYTTAFTDATSTWMNNSIDSDTDGLPDWQENLYKTDPHNPDTDGDGTSDGEEVKENRDPTKANTALKGQEPNDKIDPGIIAANQKEIADYLALSPTDKMARNIMSNIIASQPTNGSMDPQTINSIVNNTIQNIPNQTFTASTTAMDLNIIPINTKTQVSDIEHYLSVYYTQTNVFEKIFGLDLQIISSTSTSLNQKEKQMAIINRQYRAIINALIAVPIPGFASSTVVIYHVAFIDDLEKLIQIDQDAVSQTDQAIVFSDLLLYNDTISDLVNNLDILDTVLKIQRTATQ